MFRHISVSKARYLIAAHCNLKDSPAPHVLAVIACGISSLPRVHLLSYLLAIHGCQQQVLIVQIIVLSYNGNFATRLLLFGLPWGLAEQG